MADDQTTSIDQVKPIEQTAPTDQVAPINQAASTKQVTPINEATTTDQVIPINQAITTSQSLSADYEASTFQFSSTNYELPILNSLAAFYEASTLESPSAYFERSNSQERPSHCCESMKRRTNFSDPIARPLPKRPRLALAPALFARLEALIAQTPTPVNWEPTFEEEDEFSVTVLQLIKKFQDYFIRRQKYMDESAGLSRAESDRNVRMMLDELEASIIRTVFNAQNWRQLLVYYFTQKPEVRRVLPN
jgi:hypothetical protein